MTRLVADASSLVEYLLRTERGEAFERELSQEGVELHIPALCDVELVAALRRALTTGMAGEERVAQALEDYLDLRLQRHHHAGFLGRMLSLRENFSAYDAAYVALAEYLEATLLTADDRLARAIEQQLDLRVVGGEQREERD